MNTPELKEVYTKTVVPALMKKLDFVNVHQVPKIEKIVLNSSFGAEMDKNGVKDLRNDIANISGQAPVVVKAKISVSNFKLRQGMPVGVKVTLRGNQMWEFLYRLIAISLPNIRDFRGVRAKLDGNGNYSLGHLVTEKTKKGNIYKVTIGDQTFNPKSGWRIKEEVIKKLIEEDRVHIPKKKGAKLYKKIYLHEHPGKPCSDLWDDIHSISQGNEERK